MQHDVGGERFSRAPCESVSRRNLPSMATWDDVRRIAQVLPVSIEEAGQWRVRRKLFAWGRGLRKPDLEELGSAAPNGPILAARTQTSA